MLRHELALLPADRERVGQLLELADQLLERAAFDDELATRRIAAPSAGLDALIECELGAAPEDDAERLREDLTTSFESAQPPSVTASDLEAVFDHHVTDVRPHEVTELRRLSGGFSKETLRAHVTDTTGIRQDIVIRKVSPGRRADGLRPEYDVVSFVASSNVPVPKPLWYDENALGGPAFATTAVSGRTMGSVWGWTESPSLEVVRDLARAMGALHSLDLSDLGNTPLPPLRTRSDHLAAIDERAGVLAEIWNTDDAYRPVFEHVLRWLRTNTPADCTAPVLVHGDFALHNVMVSNHRISALLDWERAHIGNPSEDLAYLKPSIDQAGAWDEFVDEYRTAGGPPVNSEDLVYFTVWQDLWRAVSAYRMRSKFLTEPTQLTDAISGLLMSPRFLSRAAAQVAKLSDEESTVPEPI
ncbi:phosphotransferase family protein [Rhodococcus rhodochrous]|uniref:phosphotransferase family protein n=1 Tax=Rhodococcus rhodochrous TaxID=1829 RepID=UPI0006C8D4CE|nr:phosphotransferase family protein [Rhodococcus rhodochrous]